MMRVTSAEEEEQGRVVDLMVTVREFDPERDCPGAEAVESSCDVAPGGNMSLFTDLLGDPISRVRHSPSFLMLVAEVGCQIVGLVRGCIKVVTCGKKLSRPSKPAADVPIYTKLAYVLGLRVSPSHRRMGIGMKLVEQMEAWFRGNGAEYAYMATDKANEASLRLFTGRLGYAKFRTPSILVQPVFAHPARVSSRVAVLLLDPGDAEAIYRRRLATTEFFPRDIDAVLCNKLTLATLLAVPAGSAWSESFPGPDRFLADPPDSWAMLSVWNCGEVFRLEVRGASPARRVFAGATRLLDRALPWLGIPSIPNVFRPFEMLFLYGLGGEGPHMGNMMRALCGLAHNLARERGCRVVATEVAAGEPLRAAIPHWRRLSCAEDLWCMKRLGDDYSDGSLGDWTKAPPGPSIFVDPREF